MSEIITTTDDGRYRLRLVVDADPVNPRRDYDHLCHVITPTQRDYIDVDTDVDTDGGPLQYGWDHFSTRPDSEALFIRWARMVHGAVVIEHRPARGAWGLWYLMPDQFGETSDPEKCLRAEITEYQAWADGEVYGYIIEEDTTWTRTGTSETRTTWEEVESRWDFIGYDYALSAAKSEFAAHIQSTHAN